MIERRISRADVRLCCSLLLVMLAVVACRSGGDGRPQAPAPAAKLLVIESGMYQVTSADLDKAGLGWGQVDPAQLQLLYQGREQPLWVQRHGETFTLQFYGQASESRYVRDNVYWLERVPGGQGAGEPGSTGPEGKVSLPVPTDPSAARDTYVATLRVEENQLYSPRVEDGDHWFWALLPAPRTQDFELALTQLASGSARPSTGLEASLRIAVWGSSQAPASPDHHLRITLNDAPVADETWDGQGRHVMETDVPAGRLKEGTNTVSVEAPGDTGATADIVYLDWIEINYPRWTVAEADRLTFVGSGEPQQLSGFSGPVTLFDVTDPEHVIRVAGVQEAEREGETVVTLLGGSGHRYAALGPAGFRQPARIVAAATEPDLREAGAGADYVAVGPPDLLEPLQPLLEWRAQQGLQVMAVPLEAVYDQFNHGLPEPEAIRAFLKYAVQAWQPAPAYLLLVGDATYDPKGYLTSPEANRLPSFLISTIFGGETASDVAFAYLDDEPGPDIAVGRMPARTPEQVHILVGKILAYEQGAAAGGWQRRVLAVADGQDPSFTRAAERFVEAFPADYQAVEVFPAAGAADASQQVRRELSAGNLLVAYFGHGSVTQWGKDRLFTAADTAGLSNGDRLPVVVNMTCLTGLFTHPQVDSLAESMLWQEDGGAVAVLAPTSLTLPADQSFLSQALVETLLRNRTPTLGDAILRAQRQIPADDAGTWDVMQTFLLFGDPALRVAYP